MDGVGRLSAVAFVLSMVAVTAVGVVLWGPAPPGVSTDEYVRCVQDCKTIFPEEGESRVACIQGCAEVAKGGELAGGAATQGSEPD